MLVIYCPLDTCSLFVDITISHQRLLTGQQSHVYVISPSNKLEAVGPRLEG